MKLNKQTVYGARCLIYLAQNKGPQSAHTIAEQTGVRYSAIGAIMRQYQKAGLVGSTNGVAGGYYLCVAPGDITLHQAVSITEDVPSFHESIVEDDYFEGIGQDLTKLRKALTHCGGRMDDSLMGVTIAELAEA